MAAKLLFQKSIPNLGATNGRIWSGSLWERQQKKKRKKDSCVQYGMTFHVSAKVVNEFMQPLRAILIESHLSDSMATEQIFKISVLLKLSL